VTLPDPAPDSVADPTAGSPRAIALELVRPRDTKGFLEDRCTWATRDLDPRDAGLVRQIVLGSVRHRATLDAIVEAVSGKERRGQEARVWELLRQAAFQMVFLDRVPDHAVISETVTLVRRRAQKFANAVLRNLQRAREARLAPGEPWPDAQRTVPLPEGGGVVFTQRLFADPATRADKYLAQAWSYPAWFVQRRLDQLGYDGARRVCIAGNAPPPLTLRRNPLKATERGLFTSLNEQDAMYEPVPGMPDAFTVEWRGNTQSLTPLREGAAVVQDATAQEVAPLLNPQPGARVLDLAAAPGGKAFHCASLMQNEGSILCIDKSGPGIKRLKEGAQRCGITCIATQVGDGRNVKLPKAGFDAVVVDAPCSNTGVLRRRVEARWRGGPDGIGELAVLQQQLLARAAKCVRPGGRIVYSVCSIEAEEGPMITSRAAELGLDLRDELVRLPGSADGGYAALLVRK
jgi:16S rRNA (cytosine967-C5)-methyltransferase